MAKFPKYDEVAKGVAKRALDEFLYQGKSIREWVKIITEQEPILDKIRAEIEASKWTDKDVRIERNALASGLDKALEIIDKYRGES